MKKKSKGQLREKIVTFILILKKRLTAAEVTSYSAVVAYYLLLSLFPLMIAIGNVLPFLNIHPQNVLPYIAEFIPYKVYAVLEPVIENLLTQKSGSLLSISAIGTLWAASKSINGIRIAMNKAYGISVQENPIGKRLISFGITILLLISIFLVVGFFGMGQMIVEFITELFDLPVDILDIFAKMRWPTTLIVLVIVMSFVYFLVPNTKIRFRYVLPGTFFTALGWMFLAQVFGIYARYFTGNITSYEIFGSFIILMLWLNFAAGVLIVGGILNAVVEEFVEGKRHVERIKYSFLFNKSNNKPKKDEK